ncbi:formate/nitrite transporter family protein [Aquimarina sp. U1-2]|uniref:formate/nitrite transporter family protein n=1 Tax=Aquimarina sp. U1-2 TaxID=2823141 RepID=UPI001AEC8A8A|nr:formate/nitrite transporter family protein [Aquimarina sp. U1-2]MBP2830692.1 formate/nitrite transporter family protein [Aquimarina sp. U1-2]
MSTSKSKEKNEENIEANDNAPMSHSEILREQVSEALHIYEKSNLSILTSSFSAGLEIGFSFILICVMTAFFGDDTSDSTVWKINALVYPIGFILVVLGKSMLFTEQTSLLTLPVLNQKSKIKDLFKLWGLVIIGNICGGIIISLLAIWVGPRLGVFDFETVHKISDHVLKPDKVVIFTSAVLAGWLMGLLSWLLTSSDSTISRILVIYIITAVIGAVGLHHSIVGNIEVFSGLITSKHITFDQYIVFQITAIVGNAIGGVVFVALLKYKAFAYDR